MCKGHLTYRMSNTSRQVKSNQKTVGAGHSRKEEEKLDQNSTKVEGVKSEENEENWN